MVAPAWIPWIEKQGAMISIIIPACNESTVIKRALTGITNRACLGEIDVIVVCNGCTDDTAQQARQIESSIRVIETPTGNKTHALNIGDAAAGSVFPRVYMDADVVINIEDLRALANRLDRGDILAAAPTGIAVVDGGGLLARWYYDIARLLPSARDGFGGSGVYALSQEGRRRFGPFPNIIADDMYVQSNFRSHEYETITSATSTVFWPARLRDILRTKIRVKRGHHQVARAFPDRSRDRRRNHAAILALFRRFNLWPKLAVYCAVVVIAEIAAFLPSGKKGYRWLRDESTRMSGPNGLSAPS
jgi:glycosyltransferase involved in cell wall biosynthesis